MHFDWAAASTQNQGKTKRSPVIFLGTPHASKYTISLSIGLPVARTASAAPLIESSLHEPAQALLPRVLGNALRRQHTYNSQLRHVPNVLLVVVEEQHIFKSHARLLLESFQMRLFIALVDLR